VTNSAPRRPTQPPRYTYGQAMTAEQDVRTWLRERGAETIAHPGGHLYAHLSRVHDRLGRLGLDADVRLAGLAHAAYGTDGFDVVLLDRADRTTLRELLGEPAEAQVYRYGASDRRRTWARLAETRATVDRFTGQVETLDEQRLRAYADLSIVNEVDIAEQDPSFVDRYGNHLRPLFAAWSTIASPAVIADARRVFGT
jgi:hypothetical protein